MTIARGLLITSFVFCAGCGCGDTPAVRQVRIYQWQDTQAIEVQAAPELIGERKELKEGPCEKPVTEIYLASNRPVKIIIVPATQP